ncbi:hypothetical protein ACSQ6I_21605 [Anabaena sp. WFMT]
MTPKSKHSILDLRGLGKEIWRGIIEVLPIHISSIYFIENEA